MTESFQPQKAFGIPLSVSSQAVSACPVNTVISIQVTLMHFSAFMLQSNAV